jgi:glycosyltransferase involved in cell wall biosynthesis
VATGVGCEAQMPDPSGAYRVLHFAQDDDTSGLFPALARYHQRRRYRMYFGTLNPIAPWLRERMTSSGVTVLSCDARARVEYPLAMIRLARFLRRERIDILHTHLFEPSVVGLQAGVLARTPVKAMTRHYSDYHTRIDKQWHVRLDRLCTRRCDDVIAVSDHTSRHLIEVEGAPPAKVHTVLNGFDTSRLHVPDQAQVMRLRQEFDALEAHLLVVVGRLHPEKGYEHIFRALPAIRERVDRAVVLLVAGTGQFEGDFRHQVSALGCEREVRFLGFRDDAPALMATADLVVLPSVAEAFGIVLAEALWVGTPVVATTVGGIPEIVDDGVDGILVHPADSAALADAIAGLLNDPERRAKMAGTGREKVSERFSFESMVGEYESIYDARLRAKAIRPLAAAG